MTELDQVWFNMLDDATARAEHLGRGDVAEYLRLKATNDVIRTRGVGWLFDSFVEIAGHSHGVTIEREEPYTFPHGSSIMVGSQLQIRRGVRCLTVEAGWTRTPSDGIMFGGSLAFARITHFGMPKFGAELRLIHAENLPNWLAEDDSIIDSGELRRHFELLIGS